ncbi:hypothetical protein [Streptomyces sp. NBC_01445]|uniref:hypothetical protein n=1 Tax=Streptomyces sp. NBC_01445 TaxID=2903869 RepID=UPI002DD8B8D2|nr:hypothetical protein [Streptomyces sp. NBC_01445]WSE09187.1 hypothetical protein OG574_40995 [Streptomyces sp. NBC_01445]
MYRDSAGGWHTTEIPGPPRPAPRSAAASPSTRTTNAYAVIPRGKIVAASATSGWTDWQIVYDSTDLNAYGEVLIDGSSPGPR